MIQAVVSAGSPPPASGLLLIRTVPAGSSTGSLPKLVTEHQPLGLVNCRTRGGGLLDPFELFFALEAAAQPQRLPVERKRRIVLLFLDGDGKGTEPFGLRQMRSGMHG
jgi:hypothetical protein